MGDIYLHSPRGSNNRLNEANANRRNANRLFDSQNNNAGGYNVGDTLATKAERMEEQYKPKYFQSGIVGKSYLTIEWTNQHGCGARNSDDTNYVDCHLVMQYKCESMSEERLHPIRNGYDVSTPDFQIINPSNFNSEDYEEKQARKDQSEGPEGVNNQAGIERGRHETWENYDSCRIRNRNHNLFKADQNVGSQAINTRQNRNGQRRGYECPEVPHMCMRIKDLVLIKKSQNVTKIVT